MKKLRTLTGALLIVSAALAVTGCWNRKELDTLSIVEAIGIDNLADDRVQVSFQIVKPGELKMSGNQGGVSGSSGEDRGVHIVKSSGETVFEAARNATFEADRKLFFSHNKVIVIGERTAERGFAPLVDFLDRDHEAREGSRLFIARGQKASAILEGIHEQEKVPADAIENLTRDYFVTSRIAEIKLVDFMKTIDSRTSAPYVPGIAAAERKDDVKKTLKIDGTAILKNDRLAGWFDGKETRGLLWVEGKVQSGVIIVKSPGSGVKKAALEITRSRSRIESRLVNGRLTIEVQIKEEGNLGEQRSEWVNLTKPDTFKQLEKAQIAVIEGEVHSALTKARAWKTDIFKFGEAVHRKYPRYWRKAAPKWESIMPEIEVKVKVDAKLRRYGQRTYPDLAEE
ncbi:Ger(x)C family spore germination protein [Paenibacillus humicola]|uniref:Ger(x)C family spore germination protein n=1 Tax=Paenibacillus humicola TaxID=3110540 RepID=UPI00237BE3EF|nr:Ger(x)C family spore germination protein [Paenibacillus humicola]